MAQETYISMRRAAPGCGPILLAGLAGLVAMLLAGCGVTPGPDYSVPQQWLQQYGATQLGSSAETLGFGPESALAVATDPSSNVIVGGYVVGAFSGQSGSSSLANAYLAKYDSSGNQLWLHEFAAQDGTVIAGVATDASGNIFAVGENFDQQNTAQIFAVKADTNGNLLWLQSLPASTGASFGEQIKVEADGSAIVAGLGFFGGAGATVFAVKLAGSTGNPVWAQTAQVPGITLFTGMALDPSGDPLLTGALLPSGASTLYPFAVKLDEGSGSVLWLHQLSASGAETIPFTIASDSAGNALVGGGAYSGSQADIGFTADPDEQAVLYKLNSADGSEAWKKTYSTGKGDSITGLEVAPSGNLYAVGYTNGHFSPYDVRSAATVSLRVLDASGKQLAARQFGTGPLVNTTTYTGPLTALDPSGALLISGATTGAYPGFANANGDLQMFLAKLTPSTLVK